MASTATRHRKYYEGMVHFRTIDGRVVAFAGPDPARSSGTMWAKLKPSSSTASGAALVGKPKPVSRAGKVSQVRSAQIRAGQWRAGQNAPAGTVKRTAGTAAAMSKLKTVVGSLKPRPKVSAPSTKESAAATRASKGTPVARIQTMVRATKTRIAAVEQSMHSNPLVGGVRQDRAQFQSDIKKLKRLEATLARLNKLTRTREQRLPGYDPRTGGFIQD